MFRSAVLMAALLTGTTAMASDQAPAPDSRTVARSTFTTAIANREPVDYVTSVPASLGTVYFFTDLRGFAGETVTHRWLYNGEVMAEVSFQVEGPRWRVWSSKDLIADWTGLWTVAVVSDGQVIMRQKLSVTAPEIGAEVAPPVKAGSAAPHGTPTPESGRTEPAGSTKASNSVDRAQPVSRGVTQARTPPRPAKADNKP